MNVKHNFRKRVYEKYTTDRYPQFLNINPEKSFQKNLSPIFSRLKKWLPINKNIVYLDVACGAGQLLYGFSKIGYTNISGIDVSPEQISVAKKVCEKVYQADAIDFLSSKPNTYDLITAIDIIEHLDKDELFQFLDVAYSSLKSNGRLIIQTPNAESPFGHKIRYCDLTHENSFDSTSLNSALKISGFVNFEIQECGPIIHGPLSFLRWLLWKYISLKLIIWNLAETGNTGSRVYTRVFLAKVDKK